MRYAVGHIAWRARRYGLTLLLPLAVVLGLWGSVGLAQAQSLMDLYASARQLDPGVRAAEYTVQASQARVQQAQGARLPSLDLGVGLGLTQSDSEAQRMSGGAYVRSERKTTSSNIDLTAKLPLYRKSLSVAVQQAQSALESSQWALQVAEQDLRLRVAHAYVDVLSAQDALLLVQKQKQAVSEQLQRAKVNFEVGNTTITDSREAQARFDAISAQEWAAKSDLASKHLALAQVCNVVTATPWPLQLPLSFPLKLALPHAPDFGAPSTTQFTTLNAEWLARALQNNASLRKAQADVQTAALQVDKAQSGHSPTLDLVFKNSLTRGADNSTGVKLNNRANTQSASLAFNLPLFAGFSTQAAEEEAAALYAKAQADLDAAERSARLNLSSTWLALTNSTAQVQAYETALLSSQSALEANRLGYSVGMRVNGDVLSAESTVAQAQSDLAKARYNAIMQHVRLLQGSGQLDHAAVKALSALFTQTAAQVKTDSKSQATSSAGAAPVLPRTPAPLQGLRPQLKRKPLR